MYLLIDQRVQIYQRHILSTDCINSISHQNTLLFSSSPFIMSNVIPVHFQSLIRHEDKWPVILCQPCDAAVASTSLLWHLHRVHQMKIKDYKSLLEAIIYKVKTSSFMKANNYSLNLLIILFFIIKIIYFIKYWVIEKGREKLSS